MKSEKNKPADNRRTDIYIATWINHRTGRSGIGVVMRREGEREADELLPRVALGSNRSTVEVQAAVDLLKTAQGFPHATVHIESDYVVNGMTKWLRGWIDNGFVRKDGKPLSNPELWQEAASLGPDTVEWVKIDPEDRPPEVDIAFRLARDATSIADVEDFDASMHGAPVGRPARRPPAPWQQGRSDSLAS